MPLQGAIADRVGVPFLDLRPSHDPIKGLVLDAIEAIIDDGRFVNGPDVSAFEDAFARYCGTATCVGVGSGLDAILIALIASGLEPGSEVLVPANTFVATFEAVTQTGGLPVPVDVTEKDFNIDPEAAEAAITPKTQVLLPVHLYGQMADMRTLRTIAFRRELKLVEDACQAHGAERDGLRAGGVGDAGAFSFYPGKNLGAMGDAGALVTNDAELAVVARALREHGQYAKYQHVHKGFTARLDTIQAAVLLRKLEYLEEWNRARRGAAEMYGERLADVGDVRPPPVPRGSSPVWHLYTIRTERRDALAAYLQTAGIGTAMHYPRPPHLSEAYADLGFGRGAFPVSEALADELLSLPMFPGISPDQIERVTGAITTFFADG
jgi:dTDP-3-amino-3,4,6-trideoxy-alpha-D-glucose transaminase